MGRSKVLEMVDYTVSLSQELLDIWCIWKLKRTKTKRLLGSLDTKIQQYV